MDYRWTGCDPPSALRASTIRGVAALTALLSETCAEDVYISIFGVDSISVIPFGCVSVLVWSVYK